MHQRTDGRWRVAIIAGLVLAVGTGTAFGIRRLPPVSAGAPPDSAVGRSDSLFYMEAAAVAWQQFEQLWIPTTGLARATPDYDKLTPWDIASVLASNFSAHKLGLLPDDQYQTRMRTTLRTLARMPLYRNAVFHKMYFAQTGKMAGRNGRPSSTGYGWSATDLGRLLIWLRIIAENDPAMRADVQKVVARLKLTESVSKGYMTGGLLGTRGKLWRFQEGRIGYEQYAARGFNFWGAAVDSALDLKKHSRPVQVLGVELLADKRGLDRLNSEPFVLLGMELGFTPEMAELARAVLSAQRARYEKTGTITMVSEDAVNIPPYYFYYYCVYCNGRSFTVDVAEPGKHLDKPRWISTKATFGYHALMPDDYTKRALTVIEKARTSTGWSSGVFEGTHASTKTHDINTAAVVLESALYLRLQRPLIRFRAN